MGCGSLFESRWKSEHKPESKQWRPLDEGIPKSFPEPLACVIAFDSYTRVSGEATWHPSIGWTFANVLKTDVEVTHWMPMPKGPVGP